MALSPLIQRSTVRVSSLSQSVESLNKTFSKSINVTSNIVESLSKQNQIKNSSISERSKLFQRRREAVRRKEQEGVIEASSGVAGSIKRTGKVVMDSTKGFLGRILDFVGTLLVGWLLTNLPVIIDGVKKLGERIQKIVGVLGQTISDITSFLTGFGQLIGATITNILTLNFTDSENRIRDATNKIDNSLNKLYGDMNQLYNLFSTPLDFGLENIFNDLDEAERDAAAMIPSEGEYAEPSDQISGGRVSPQAVYQYLRSLGVSHIHALGILANIQGESSFQVGVTEKGGSRSGIGLFQYTYPSRKNAFLQAVPDYKTNWKGQVKFAISEGVAPQYFRQQFNTPEEAAAWWMRKWEKPDPALYSSRDREHTAFIKNFRVPQPSRPSFTSPKLSPAQIASGKLRKGQDVSSIGQGVGRIQITDNYGARGGDHKGIDIAAPSGTYIAVRDDAQIISAGWYGNYGYTVDIWLINQRVQLRFAHCSQILIKSGRVPAGTSFARVGSTGGSTGPHIHFEYSTKYNDTTYGGSGDASAYVPLILLTKYKNGGQSAAVVSSTKETKLLGIDTTRGADVSSLSRKKQGSTIFISPPPSPQPQKVAGGSSGSLFSSSNPESSLNTYWTGKILLDLAYN